MSAPKGADVRPHLRAQRRTGFRSVMSRFTFHKLFFGNALSVMERLWANFLLHFRAHISDTPGHGADTARTPGGRPRTWGGHPPDTRRGFGPAKKRPPYIRGRTAFARANVVWPMRDVPGRGSLQRLTVSYWPQCSHSQAGQIISGTSFLAALTQQRYYSVHVLATERISMVRVGSGVKIALCALSCSACCRLRGRQAARCCWGESAISGEACGDGGADDCRNGGASC